MTTEASKNTQKVWEENYVLTNTYLNIMGSEWAECILVRVAVGYDGQFCTWCFALLSP